MEGKGEEEAAENVVRFPRDWVGPLEDLVPIGSRARARDHHDQDDAGRIADGVAPIAADDFWSESASAVHDAIQGPARAADVAPPRPRRPRRRRPRLPEWHGAVRWPAILAAVVVVAVAAVAAVGLTDGPSATGQHHPATQAASLGGSSTPRTRGTGARPSHLTAKRPTHHARVHLPRTAASHATGHHASKRPAHHSTPDRRRAAKRPPHKPRQVTHHPARTAVHQVTTVTVQAPTPTTVAPAVTSASPPVESAAASEPVTTSASGSGGGGSASPGPAGPTGVGSVSRGCNPKCS